MRALIVLVTVALLAFGAAACGKRGPLEPPPGAKEETRKPASG
jgi:predicted small lipoprotein YifL